MGRSFIPQSALIGKRNGRLVCLYELPRTGRQRRFMFRCDCGREKDILMASFTSKRAVSCGCISRENIRKAVQRRTMHMGFKAEFKTWRAMIARCTKPESQNYKLYGGRGIKVCSRWLESFSAFLQDMGPRPEGHSIDRIDNNGNYEPANCRWATAKQQTRNTRKNRVIEFAGESLLITEWAERLGTKSSVINARLKAGWSVKQALTKPVREKRDKPKVSAARYTSPASPAPLSC